MLKKIPSSPHSVIGFDVAALEELVDGDRELFEKFTLIFIDSFETALSHIDRALITGDRDLLCAMGHRAKSTARNIGAMALGEECETLEEISTVADFKEVTRVAVRLRPMFEAVRAELSMRMDPPENRS